MYTGFCSSKETATILDGRARTLCAPAAGADIVGNHPPCTLQPALPIRAPRRARSSPPPGSTSHPTCAARRPRRLLFAVSCADILHLHPSRVIRRQKPLLVSLMFLVGVRNQVTVGRDSVRAVTRNFCSSHRRVHRTRIRPPIVVGQSPLCLDSWAARQLCPTTLVKILVLHPPPLFPPKTA